MIKRIKIAGLRGKSFDLELSPLTLVIGPNTAGKTTIADAIRWGVLGYIPGMAQPPRGWIELVGNGQTQASVELKLAKGSVERTLYLENGSPKMRGLGEGGYGDVNVLGLDPAKFLEATGPVRAQMVADATTSGFDWRAAVPVHLQADHFENWKTWPAWIEAALNDAKEQRSNAALNKKTLTATLRGLEGLREMVVEDDAEIKNRLDEGKEKLGSLKEQLRAVTKQIANVKDNPSSQQQLDAVLKALQEFLGKEHDEDSHHERWKDLGQRTKEWMELGKTGDKVAPSLDQLSQELASARKTETLAFGRLDRMSEDTKKLDQKYKELRKLKRCPTCGSAGKGLTEALRIAEDAEVRRLAAEAARLLKEHKEAETETKRIEKLFVAAQEYEAKGKELDEERQKLEDEAALITLWKKHDALVAEVNEQRQGFDLQGLEERRYDIQCEMQEQDDINRQIELELSQLTYKRGQKKQLETVETELANAEADWEFHNRAVKELELLRDRLTAMSLEPLLGVMARFTDGIFDEPLSLDGTELGRMVESRWVPLNQFSGSEQAVAIAALSCALKGNPEHKNLVLADELGSFDDSHLSQFLINVAGAIESGALEQFIGFSTPRKLIKSFPKSLVVLPI